MQDEILQIINKNLPNEVGSMLKKRLEQAELDAAKVTQLTTLNKNQEDELKKLRALALETERVAGETKALAADRRSHLLDEARFDIEKKLVDLREKHALERVAEIRNLTETVFKNKQLVTTAYTSGMKPVTDPGGYSTDKPYNESTTTTSEEE